MADSINLIIGRNLKRLRKDAGLTQQDVADKLNAIGRKTWNVSISQYESGKTAVSYDLLLDFTKIFNCKLSNITGYTDSASVDLAEMLRTAADIIENTQNKQ